jgi:hypothetical protein
MTPINLDAMKAVAARENTAMRMSWQGRNHRTIQPAKPVKITVESMSTKAVKQALQRRDQDALDQLAEVARKEVTVFAEANGVELADLLGRQKRSQSDYEPLRKLRNECWHLLNSQYGIPWSVQGKLFDRAPTTIMYGRDRHLKDQAKKQAGEKRQ